MGYWMDPTRDAPEGWIGSDVVALRPKRLNFPAKNWSAFIHFTPRKIETRRGGHLITIAVDLESFIVLLLHRYLILIIRLYGRRKCPLNPWSCCGIMLNARYEHFHRRQAGIFFWLKVISFGFILTSLTNRGFEFRSKLRTISGMSPK